MYNISFRCYYADGTHTSHRQDLLISDVGLWISAYKFTHPACVSVSVRLWFDDENDGEAV